MYNHAMAKKKISRGYSPVFLILGLAFLAIGISTDRTVFTWIAIVLVLLSLFAGGKWLRPRK